MGTFSRDRDRDRASSNPRALRSNRRLPRLRTLLGLDSSTRDQGRRARVELLPLAADFVALEQRIAPATFAGSTGNPLAIDLNAASSSLAIVANAGNYTLTLTGDTWTSSDIVGGATVSGGTTLTVTKDFFSSLQIGDSDTGAAVTFDTSGANSYTDDLSVTLNNATPGSVTFNGSTTFSSANALSVSTIRDIVVSASAIVSTDSGNLTLEANFATSTSGNFQGVTVNAGATVKSTSGELTVKGKGGDDSGGSQYGVFVTGASATIGSASGGNVTVMGIGGNSTGTANYGVYVLLGQIASGSSGNDLSVTGTGGSGAGNDNYGVVVNGSGSKITSGGGNVSVMGTGGSGSAAGNYGVYATQSSQITSGGGAVTIAGTGGGSGSGAANYGVFVDSSAKITSGGGNVSVMGNGGSGSGSSNHGVYVTSGQITSGGGGNVTVMGTGGGSGLTNFGVYVVSGGQITSGGAGTVEVTGTGGSGTGNLNYGVVVSGSGSAITSGGGAVSVTGTSTTNNSAVVLEADGAINSGGGASITVIADSLAFTGSPLGAINSGAGATTLRQRTTGTLINLGGADVLSGSPLTLGLTDAELDRVTAGTLNIGDSNSGNITFSAAIDRSVNTNINLTTGAGKTIAFGTFSLNAGSGGDVSLTTSGAGAITTGDATGTDVTGDDLTITAGSGGVGVGNFLRLAGATITATTSGDGGINLVEADSITIAAGGLNAGTGAIGLGGGTFTLGGSNRINDAADLGVFGSATLALGTNTETIDQLSLVDGSVTGSGAGALTGTSTFDVRSGSISAILAGSVGLTKTTGGTVTLSGTNTYTGTTTISDGTLTVSGGAAILDGSAVTIDDANNTAPFATLTLAGSETIGNLSSNGDANVSVVLSTFTLTVSQTGTTTYAGSITNVGGGALTKSGVGTLTLSGNNTYTGATTISQGTLTLSGAFTNNIANSLTIDVQSGAFLDVTGLTSGTLVLASGQTLKGAGTVTGATFAASGSFISPGASPGILNTGNVAFNSGSTFTVEVNGSSPGTQYDQLNVTGTVSLGNATLSRSGTITSSPGQTLVIINNDSNDAVTGTFNGLAEGATVTINSINFLISYVGGTNNNDVVLVEAQTSIAVSGGNLVVTDSNGGTTADTLTIKSDTTLSKYIITDPSNALYAGPGATQINPNQVEVPFASVTGTIQINTLSGDDSLTVDFSMGNFSRAISYTGGNQTTSDSLTLTGGGPFTTVTHTFANANDGTVAITGNSLITYTGLEPIADNLSAVDRVFTFNPLNETITVTDGTAADGKTNIDSTAGESVYFTNPTGSLTINAGTGNDTVTITSVDAGYNVDLTINGDGGNDTVNLNGDITFASGEFLDVNLQNDATAGDVDSISIGTNANLILSGSGTATLKASKSISLASGSSVVTASGAIVIEANQQGTPTSGNFIGVDVNNALVQTTSGTLTVKGKGGDDSATGQHGVRLVVGGGIIGGSSGLVTVEGIGGAGSGGYNFGVYVNGTGTKITSGGADVSVTGTGGSVAGANTGVDVGAGGQVTSGGSGSVTVTGFGGGGSGSGNDNFGVNINFSYIPSITSGGAGTVTVTGTGGSGTGAQNYGVLLIASGQVRSGGAGTVTVTGTGGSGAGASNHGVYLSGPGCEISTASSTGAVSVTGTAGPSSSSVAVLLDTSASIQSNNQPITITGDTVQITSATVNAGSSSATIRPLTLSRSIDLGTETAGSLSLTSTELDSVTAGVVRIGRTDGSGNISVTAAVSPAGTSTLALLTGGAGNIGDGAVDAAYLVETNVRLVTGSGDITFTNNPDVGNANNFGTVAASTTGVVILVDANDLTVGSVDSLDGITAAGVTLRVNLDGTGVLTIADTPATNDISATGFVTLTADNMDIVGTVNAPGQNVVLQNDSNGRAIILGSETGSALRLTNAELGRVTANRIRVGRGTTSDIAIAGPITITTTSEFGLFSNGTISDTNASDPDITMASGGLALRAVSGIAAGTTLEIAVVNLAVTVTGTGNASISNTGALTVPSTSIDNQLGIDLADGNLILSTTAGLTANESIIVLGAGTMSLNADSDATGGGTFTLAASMTVSTAGGDLTVTASDIVLNGTALTATSSGKVFLRPSAAQTIGLGGAAGTFNLTDAEADTITASILEIGTSAAGNIAVNDISPASATTLVLRTDGGVTEGTGDGLADIVVTNLAIDSDDGVNIDVNVTTLAASNTVSGAIDISDTAGGLTVGTVTTGSGTIVGVTNSAASSGGITLVAASPLTVNSPVVDSGGGNITLTSTNDGGNDDHLTINANVTASGGNGNITLNAGTDLLQTSGTVSAAGTGTITGTAARHVTMSASTTIQTASGAIGLTATVGDITSFIVESTGNATITLNASGSISEQSDSARLGASGSTSILDLTAGTTIGASGSAALNTDVGVLRVNAGGAVFIAEANGLQVGSSGVGVTTSNDNVTICVMAGSLVLAENVSIGAGILRLQTDGASSGISQSGGAITASSLGMRSGTGGISATSASNDVDTIAAATGGGFAFVDADGFSIGTVTADGCFTPDAVGITLAGNLELCMVGALTINAPLNAGANTIRIKSASVTQTASGVVTAGALGIEAAGAIDLDVAATNDVDTIAFITSAAGAIEFAGINGVTVGTVLDSGSCLTADVNGVTSNNGLVTISNSTSGGITISQPITSSTDSDSNDITVTTSTSNVVVGMVVGGTGTLTDVTITATTGSILDNTSDSSTDITGDVVTLTAATGVGQTGGAGTLDTAANSLDVSVTGTGGIWIDESNAVTLTAVDTNHGSITITSGGAMTITNVTSSTDNDSNDVSLTATTGNVIVGVVVGGTGTLTDVTITATAGSIVDNTSDGVTDVTGDVVTLTAATGVGETGGAGTLDTAANSLDVSVTGTGGIWIDESNAVTLTAVDTNHGSITITSGGAMTITNVTSSTDNDSNDVSLTATTGNVIVGVVVGGTGTLTDVTITATAGSILDNISDSSTDITGDVVTLTAATGVGESASAGTLDTAANTLDVSVTGTGGVWIDETNAVDLNPVDTNDGLIIITSGGAMTATSVTAGGTGRNVTLTTTSGNIVLGLVTASGDLVTLTAAAAISDGDNSTGNDVDAGQLVMTAAAGIGGAGANATIETTIANLEASGGTDGVYLTNTGALTIGGIGSMVGVSATGGAIVITAASPLTVNEAVVDSGGGNITLTASGATAADDLTINANVTASGGNGNISLNAGDDILQTSGTISAVGSGAITATAATGTATGVLTQSTGTFISAATGNITLSADGNVTLTSVSSSGNITVTSTTAAIEEAGSDGTADIVGATLDLNAVTGIGTAGTLEITGTTITADSTGTGNVDIDSLATSGVTVTTLTAGTGNITFDQTGGQTLAVTTSTATGSIIITNAGANLTATTVTASGAGNDVTLTTTTSGNVLVGNVSAADLATITAAGSIEESGSDGTADVTATTIDLNAVSGIGTAGTLEITGTTITADSTGTGNVDIDSLATAGVTVTTLTAGTGNIAFDQTGGQTLAVTTSTTTNGSITITNAGANLTVGTVTAVGSSRNISLTTTTSGNISVDNATAAGDTITINAAGSITENGSDGGDDVTAAIIDLDAASGIGTAGNALEIAGQTITANNSGNAAINLVNNSASTTTVSGTGITTGQGNITFTQVGGGALNFTGPVTLNGTAGDDVLITNSAANIDVASAFSTSGGSGGVLTITGASISPGALFSLGAGDITINGGGTDFVLNTDITVAGDADFSAVCDILINAVLTTTGAGSDVTLTADSDANGTGGVRISTAGQVVSAGNVTMSGSDLCATGTIGDAIVIAADGTNTQVVTTSGDITLGMRPSAPTTADVDVSGVVQSGSGNILIQANDSITFAATGDVASTSGNVTVTANVDVNLSGVITMADGALINAGSGLITLSAYGDVTLGGLHTTNATTSAVSVTSTAGNILDGGDTHVDVVADSGRAVLTAALGIGTGGNALETTVGSLDASVTGAGLINISESNTITLFDVDTFNGPITITSGGAMTATDVVSSTDNDANDITLTATTGNVIVGVVNAGTSNGDVTITATAGSIIDDAGDSSTDITGDVLTLTASTGIGQSGGGGTLDVRANSLDASVTAAGLIAIDEFDAITLFDVDTFNGPITITSGGAMTATDVVSSTDNDANDITLTATTGNVIVGVVNAGTSNGDVTITATTGSIIDDAGDSSTDITGDVLTLTASMGIGQSGGGGTLDIRGNSLDASVTAAGLIAIDEFDAITLTDVDTFNGSITITSGGAMIVTDVQSLMDTDANDITLTALTGNMTVTLVNAGTTDGDVNLTATAGAIVDGAGAPNVTADVLTAVAPNGIELDTAINCLAATAIGTGADITIRESNGLGLLLVTADDLVTLTLAAGSITDKNGAGNNVNAVNLVMTGPAGIGTGADAIETTVTNLEATGGSGGVYLVNTGSLTIGGITAMVGVSATGGAIDIRVTGTSPVSFVVSELVENTGGNVTLTEDSTAGGVVTLNAAVQGSGTVWIYGGTGQDTINVNVSGTSTLNLDGKGDNDTYNILKTGLGTAAGDEVNIVDTGVSLGDTANLNGDPAVAENFTMNAASTKITETVAGKSVSYTGALDLFRVRSFGPTGPNSTDAQASVIRDVFLAVPSLTTAYELDGGSPTGGIYGDRLTVDFPAGDSLILVGKRIIGVSLTPSLTFYAPIDFIDIEELVLTPAVANPGLASNIRRYDFNLVSTSVTTAAGYVGVLPSRLYSTFAGASPITDRYGWSATMTGIDRAAPNPTLRDGHATSTNVARTFQVGGLEPGYYMATINLGDQSLSRSNVTVTAEGVPIFSTLNPYTGGRISTLATKFENLNFVVKVSADGIFDLQLDAPAGFAINSLDLRPSNRAPEPPAVPTSGLLSINLTPPPATSQADGVTIDTVYGSNARPNTLITVLSTLGTITTLDGNTSYNGIQVMSDAAGNFSFQVRRPTGTGFETGRVEARDVTGFQTGCAPLRYDVPVVRRLDFNSSSSITATNYTAVRASDTTAANGLDQRGFAWATGTIGELDRVTTSALRRDGHWGTSGTFQIQVKPGTSYGIRYYVGDVLVQRDLITIAVTGGIVGTSVVQPSDLDNAETAVGTTKAPTRTFTTSAGSDRITISISDAGGVNPNFTVLGIDLFETGSDPGATPLTASVVGSKDSTSGKTVPVITTTDVQPLVETAIQHWESLGLPSEWVATLRGTPVLVEALPDTTGHLGETTVDGRIVLDDDAAGIGWFVDRTPGRDEEFTRSLNQGRQGFDARPGSEASGRYDLLTTLMHEMGHILGLDDVDRNRRDVTLMTEDLTPGIRRLPSRDVLFVGQPSADAFAAGLATARMDTSQAQGNRQDQRGSMIDRVLELSPTIGSRTRSIGSRPGAILN